jgi:hypothetical protein
MGIGGFEIENLDLAFGDLVNGGVRSSAGIGEGGSPDELPLTICAIIQHKPGDTVLDGGANTNGDAVLFEFFDLARCGFAAGWFGFSLTALAAPRFIYSHDRLRIELRQRDEFLRKNGRGGEIRTHDLLHPKQAR